MGFAGTGGCDLKQHIAELPVVLTFSTQHSINLSQPDMQLLCQLMS